MKSRLMGTFLALAGLCAAQTPAEIFRRFQWKDAGDRLKGPRVEAAKTTLTECKRLADEIQPYGERSFPPEYLRSLDSNSRDARQIIDQGYMGDAQAAELKTIAEDLQLKVSSLKQNRPALDPFQKIGVAIHTRSIAAEQPGFEVWWAFFSDRQSAAAYTKLRKDSSPAAGELYPGVYVMFAKRGSEIGPKTKVQVDGTRKPPFDFDLPTR